MGAEIQLLIFMLILQKCKTIVTKTYIKITWFVVE